MLTTKNNTKRGLKNYLKKKMCVCVYVFGQDENKVTNHRTQTMFVSIFRRLTFGSS